MYLPAEILWLTGAHKQVKVRNDAHGINLQTESKREKEKRDMTTF